MLIYTWVTVTIIKVSFESEDFWVFIFIFRSISVFTRCAQHSPPSSATRCRSQLAHGRLPLTTMPRPPQTLTTQRPEGQCDLRFSRLLSSLKGATALRVKLSLVSHSLPAKHKTAKARV